MRGVALPRGILALPFLAAAIPSCLAAMVLVRGHRYADWFVIDVALGRILLLVLPAVALAGMAVARVAVGDDLLWLRPTGRRSGATLGRTTGAVGTAAAAGYLAGWLPALGWGMATATAGAPDPLHLTQAVCWVAAVAVLAVLLTHLTGSVWPAVALAGSWYVLYVLGLRSQRPYQQLFTRWPLLPSDALQGLDNGHAVRMNPFVAGLRLTGAAAVVAFVLWACRTAVRHPARSARLKAVLVSLPTAGLLVVLVAGSLRPVPLFAARAPEQVCRSSGTVRVCVDVEHRADLPAVATMVSRLQRVAPPRLLGFDEVSERAGSPARVVLGTDRRSDMEQDIAAQLAAAVIGDACPPAAGPDAAAARQVLLAWFTALADPRQVSVDPAAETLVRSWTPRARQVNAALAQRVDDITGCRITLRELPR